MTPLLEALQTFPVVALLGARQVGKSTLVRMLVEAGWRADLITLDDFDVLSLARGNPDDFVDGLKTPVVIDEVQRAPDLLRAVKRVVDRRREPGRFLLTGSANLMTMKGITESLAGRVCLFELLPLSHAELARAASPSRGVELLFEVSDARELVAALEGAPVSLGRSGLMDAILAGGYPDVVLATSSTQRARWLEAYRRTYLERDLREIAHVQDLISFGQLLTAIAATTGEIANFSRLSRDLAVSHNTVRRHIDLLETTYQVFRVAPYAVNVRRRVVKTPKLYFTDTGLACHLTGAENARVLDLQGRTGALVETWVATELRKMISVMSRPAELFFWRMHSGDEVDFLISRGTRLVAIEIKAARTVRSDDLKGLRRAKETFGDRLGVSVVLHGGSRAFAPEPGIAILPLGAFVAGMP